MPVTSAASKPTRIMVLSIRCYDAGMRTTLTIDDALMRDLRRAAHDEGTSLKEIVNRALRAGLTSLDRPPEREPYRARTYSMGEPTVGLDKAMRVVGELEDDEVVRKIALRK